MATTLKPIMMTAEQWAEHDKLQAQRQSYEDAGAVAVAGSVPALIVLTPQASPAPNLPSNVMSGGDVTPTPKPSVVAFSGTDKQAEILAEIKSLSLKIDELTKLCAIKAIEPKRLGRSRKELVSA